MKTRTNTLTGAALDWAVAKCEGRSEPEVVNNFAVAWYTWGSTHYSTNWSQGGPIIERESIRTWPKGGGWAAESFVPNQQGIECVGPTILIAAMRCFVASCLGDEIDVPDDLLGTN